MNMWKEIATERRRLATELERLTPAEWAQPTVCTDWNVQAVATHLVLPFEVSKLRFVLRALRNRRDVPKTVVQLTNELVPRMSPHSIVASLRTNAESTWKPPGTGPQVPLGEIVVHGHDIRHALSLPCNVPATTIDVLLAAIEDPSIRADYATRIAGVPA